MSFSVSIHVQPQELTTTADKLVAKDLRYSACSLKRAGMQAEVRIPLWLHLAAVPT